MTNMERPSPTSRSPIVATRHLQSFGCPSVAKIVEPDLVLPLFGMNSLPTSQCIEIWNRILQLTRAGTIRPVIGQEIEFADVPAALEGRETTGRTVVHPPPIGGSP